MKHAVLKSLAVHLALGTSLIGGLEACGRTRPDKKAVCDVAVDPTCDPNLTGGTLGTCVIDSECPVDQYCNGGTCDARNDNRPDDPCAQHQDCSFGMFCNLATGVCVSCLNDDHCDLGLSCRADGTCGVDAGCTTNFDCGALVCETNSSTCVQCITSADCPLGQTCRENACFVDNSSGQVPCTTQADCSPYGRICDANAGTCVPCTTNPECGDGMLCSGGVCTIDPGTGPTGPSGPGNNGGTCVTIDDCGGEACLLGTCAPCFADFMCIDLLGGATYICDIFSGQCIAPDCATADDCAAGEACFDGHCGACLYDYECRAGETCNTSSGVCESGGTPPGCVSNSECSGGQVCVAGNCADCTSNGQCDVPDVCNMGRCGPDTGMPQCTSNAQCTGGLVCVSEMCLSCTSTTECDPGDTCNTGTGLCEGPPTGSGAFGDPCSQNSDCTGNLTCLTDTSGGICTRTCIGSGNGGDADCPSGFACQNFESGSLDGIMLCNGAARIDPSYPGQPFTTAPGASCAAGNTCQTSVCFSDTNTCAQGCAANRDCDAGDVCWSVWSDATTQAGMHLCYGSDLTQFKGPGDSCTAGTECDSGLCVGTCGLGGACNSDADCGLFDLCTGQCQDHCRNNSDCMAGQACAPWPTSIGLELTGWVPACQAKYYSGTAADGTSCSGDDECDSDWCVGGICTQMCAIDADCTGMSGTSCQPVTFLDSSQNPVYSSAFCQP